MKKIFIPTILTATILIAGMFAMMPVEKANAVHTTVLAGSSNVQALQFNDADPTEGTDVYTIACDKNFAASINVFNVNDGTTDDETVLFTTTAASSPALDADSQVPVVAAGYYYRVENILSTTAASDMTVTLGGTADGDDGTLRLNVTVFTTGDAAVCTITETA